MLSGLELAAEGAVSVTFARTSMSTPFSSTPIMSALAT